MQGHLTQTISSTDGRQWAYLGLVCVMVLVYQSSIIKLFQKLPDVVVWARKYVRAWKFLFDAPAQIQGGFDKAKGEPYEIVTPGKRFLLVSSPQHIQEVNTAPDSVLSLLAAAKEVLQPQYSMHNFVWSDRRGTDGFPLIKTIGTILTNNIPQILPDLSVGCSTIFDEVLENCKSSADFKRIPLHSMIMQAVTFCNARAFFGEELARDKAFLDSSVAFIKNTLVIAESVRLLPSFVAPTVGRYLARRFEPENVLFHTLVAVAEERIAERDKRDRGFDVPLHKDCIQWIMDTTSKSKPWSATRIAHEMIALWFGSVHTLSTTICFAIHDLCLHPEYVEPLREEFQGLRRDDFLQTGKGLPLMDSFIRESARLTPLESMGTRRQALKPFTLSGGSRAEPGDWVCTPAMAMSRDATRYSEPLNFHGFRFVDPQSLAKAKLKSNVFTIPTDSQPLELIHVPDWQFWGTGRMACPGRHYAASVIKVMIGLFVTKYDTQLADPQAPRSITWRTWVLPRSETCIDFRPRR